MKDVWRYAENYRTAGQSVLGKYMAMENIFEFGVLILVTRINSLRRTNEIHRLHNDTVIKDIFAGFEHEYEPWAFQINRGTFFPTIKANPAKYVKPVTAVTKRWLKSMREQNKVVFLCTSSNADYAKHILQNIFVDENGKAEDYWQYFDVCLCDARKPYFFTNNNPFQSMKQDYPDTPVKRLETGRWYAQGNHNVVEEFCARTLNLKSGQRPTVCYFGDSLKSDVINCTKVARWSPVYLVEELLLSPECKVNLLEDGDSAYLSGGIWNDIALSDTLLYSLALKHASLILPTIESISGYPLDHEFNTQLFY